MASKTAHCHRLTARGYRLEACWGVGSRGRELKLTARDERGRRVGKIRAVQEGSFLTVADAYFETPSQGLGTALYEAAAKEACTADLRLSSDIMLTEYSSGMWDKQRKKGRATCRIGWDQRGLEPALAKWREGEKTERASHPRGRGGCFQYALEPGVCQREVDLGRPKRKKRKR